MHYYTLTVERPIGISDSIMTDSQQQSVRDFCATKGYRNAKIIPCFGSMLVDFQTDEGVAEAILKANFREKGLTVLSVSE